MFLFFLFLFSFITLISVSLIFCPFSYEKKMIIIKKYLIYVSLISSSIFSFIFLFFSNEKNLTNIKIFSLIFINITILIFAFLIFIFLPFFISLSIKMFLKNKNLFKEQSKKILIYSSIVILSSQIIYLFQNENIFFEYSDVDLKVIHFLKLIIKFLFKNNWTCWIHISYFLICLFFVYLYHSSKSKNCVISKKQIDITQKINLSIFLTAPMSFVALTFTLLINPLSLIYRFLIVLLIMFISLIIFYIVKKIKYPKKIYIFPKKEKENYLFIQNSILPIIFSIFLVISDNELFNQSILNQINFWICLFIATYLNSLLSPYKYFSFEFNKYNLPLLTPYIISGINTSYLSCFNFISFNLFSKACSKLLVF